MTHIMRWLLPVAFAVSAAVSANAQNWPDRPIKFISSQAAGGGTDIIGRLVADQLSARVGQPVVYENRPGGGNVIGTQAAARSAPDGYTFFFATAAALVTDPYTFKSLPYDPMKDFMPVVSRIAEVIFMVLAHPDVPAKYLTELFAYAKANPDKLSIATDGRSGASPAWSRVVAQQARRHEDFARALHRRWDAGIQDVIAGRVPAHHPRRPRSRSVAVARGQAPPAGGDVSRSGCRELPDVPAVAETFPGFDFAGWLLLAAPTGVPSRSSERVNRELDGIMKDPAVLGSARAHAASSTPRRRHA